MLKQMEIYCVSNAKSHDVEKLFTAFLAPTNNKDCTVIDRALSKQLFDTSRLLADRPIRKCSLPENVDLGLGLHFFRTYTNLKTNCQKYSTSKITKENTELEEINVLAEVFATLFGQKISSTTFDATLIHCKVYSENNRWRLGCILTLHCFNDFFLFTE